MTELGRGRKFLVDQPLRWQRQGVPGGGDFCPQASPQWRGPCEREDAKLVDEPLTRGDCLSGAL